MVNHLGNATHVKAHTRHAARHSLDNGIGQVVLQRGRDKQVHSIVQLGYLGLAIEVVYRIDRQRQGGLDGLGIPTQHDDAQLFCQVGMSFHNGLASLLKVTEALALVGDALCAE